jgi:hypothetical protein
MRWRSRVDIFITLLSDARLKIENRPVGEKKSLPVEKIFFGVKMQKFSGGTNRSISTQMAIHQCFSKNVFATTAD